MVDVEIPVVLEFLNNWKTRNELSEKFSLSNSGSFRLLRWLKKGDYIVENKMVVKGHNNKVWYYKVKINASSGNDLYSY